MKPLVFLLSAALTGLSTAELRSEKTDSSLKIFDGDKLITEYRTDSSVPYLYPLVGPSGTGLTRSFPMVKDVAGEQSDHPHHRSFWFTHGNVNGHDFWHDPKHNSKIQHQSFENVKGGTFTANLHWTHKDKIILKEKRTYQFEKLSDKALSIVVNSQITAEIDAKFADTKEGSFALRIAPTLRHKGNVAKGQLANSEGQIDGKVWGKRAKWVSVHGPDSKGQATVITMMDHPENLRHPTWWHARTYGLIAANPFGKKDFGEKESGDYNLKRGKTLTQRYGILLESGKFDKEAVAKSYQKFAN
ncbi:MAG TPA: hypothetical protein DDW68_12055 [Verrucomicrobiales bacterium]|mgnify:FL=1|nr:hypothetical protein [Verrucomicrobiales bacterium]HBE97894.1 hypothetical protein [Verrucomicrobiales bacterium]